MIKAIIFDVYGTLIDTADKSIKATQAILTKNNSEIDAIEFYREWKKYFSECICSSTFIKEQDAFLISLFKLYNAYKIEGNPEEDVLIMLSTLGIRSMFSETLSVLGELRKNYKLYIGSNTDDEPLLKDFKRNGIGVDGYYTSESLKVYKPKKEFFREILERINMSPDDVIYVGDSQIDDILGANSAGIKNVWINRKNEPLQTNVPRPDYEITDLRELIAILS